ncbi:MAG: protein kinase [Spartobacteria bacterium]
MHSPAREGSLTCEQCGAPLQSSATGEGCLNCLLRTGLEDERAQRPVTPNESAARFYQHYEILTRPDGSPWELGRGTLGVTYKARDANLDTPVALKIIDARFSRRPSARRHFLQEAQSAAQLRHPNVASVFHFGTLQVEPAPNESETGKDVGNCFYAMEFVEGESLEERVRRTGLLAPGPALQIALQVARALAAAEKCGLLHRDLKPSNIMLTTEGETSTEPWVKVIGFGVSRLPREAREATGAERRPDLFSLGAILHQALTGRVFSGPLLMAPAGIPAPVGALLQSMLGPVAKDRPRSAIELCEILQRCLKELSGVYPASERPRRTLPRRWVLAGGLALSGALIGLAIYLSAPPPLPREKSIAVLPFRNLSSDPNDAFFVEGIQDDILSRLVKMHDLRVISRLGTVNYPANKPRDLRAIGRALEVRHLLEGSLRRSGDRVYLHVALVDTRDGRELWSEGYDRKLADAINRQGELASDIADTLDAKLSPQERLAIRFKSTRNPDAYLLYLQGRKLENSLPFAISGYEAAEALYSQAVALDPGFALAHARLASTLGLLYRFRGPSEALKARADGEAREALRLQPGLGEAHLVQGRCAYLIERDFDRALPFLETARRLLPNDVEAESLIALIQRRSGHWREALSGLERAHSRDPLDESYERELYSTAIFLRDWPAAVQHAARAIELAPKLVPLRGERAVVDFWQKGDLVPLQNFFASFDAYGDPEGTLTWARWDAAMLARDFSKAQAALDGFPFATLSAVLSAPVPKSYLEGCIWLAQGRTDRAQGFFERARPAMEAEILGHPNDAIRHARLGLLYAYLGRKGDAIHEGERAVQLTPVTRDAIEGHQWLCHLALIHARVGNTEEAISMVEALLRAPGCVSPVDEASMTLSELRLRWQWDPLRKDPRFQQILDGPEPKTVF